MLAVKSLPSQTLVNLTVFGKSLQPLFPESRPCSDVSVAWAGDLAWILSAWPRRVTPSLGLSPGHCAADLREHRHPAGSTGSPRCACRVGLGPGAAAAQGPPSAAVPAHRRLAWGCHHPPSPRAYEVAPGFSQVGRGQSQVPGTEPPGPLRGHSCLPSLPGASPLGWEPPAASCSRDWQCSAGAVPTSCGPGKGCSPR